MDAAEWPWRQGGRVLRGAAQRPRRAWRQPGTRRRGSRPGQVLSWMLQLIPFQALLPDPALHPAVHSALGIIYSFCIHGRGMCDRKASSCLHALHI